VRRKARPRGRQAQSASARCGAGSVSPRPPSLRIAPMLPTADSYAAKIEMRVDRRTAMTLTACFSFQEAPVGKSHNTICLCGTSSSVSLLMGQHQRPRTQSPPIFIVTSTTHRQHCGSNWSAAA
jgi:hypothetical protein